MKNLSSKAIILGKRDFGEKNHLVTFYTEQYGKITAIAKGSRKISSRFIGHLETLNLCEIQIYQGPKNKILTEIHTIKHFPNIREDLQKISCASKILEISNKLLFPEQKIDNLFILIEKTIEQINSTNLYTITHLNYCLKLLDLIGVIPNLKEINSPKHQKYLNFFTLLQTSDKLPSVKLKQEEKHIAETLLKKIIERELENQILTF